MPDVPSPWEAVLLAGAAFRVFRLLAADVILDGLRDRLTRRAQWEEGLHREGLDQWLHCPWCLGFWVTIGWWAAWTQWPEATVAVAVPWALSAAVALVAKNLDP